MRKTRKPLITILSVALVAALGIGATVAWLTDKTQTVTNTFTVGDINITLVESDSSDADTDANNNAYKMVPGNVIDKDPTVTVKANSEDCYLFVKVEKSSTLDTYIDWCMADGWMLVPGQIDVYYQTVSASTADQVFDVIGYKAIEGSDAVTVDKVKVKDSVTKSQMEALSESGATQPTLKFTAYAVQQDNIADVATAWAKVG